MSERDGARKPHRARAGRVREEDACCRRIASFLPWYGQKAARCSLVGDPPSEDAAAVIRLPPSAIAAAAARGRLQGATRRDRVIVGDLDIERALRDPVYLKRIMSFLCGAADRAGAPVDDSNDRDSASTRPPARETLPSSA